MSDGLRITLQDASASPNVPGAGLLEQWLRAALGSQRSGEITLRVVGEVESADLNWRYRGQAGPTNVLAFPADAMLPAAAQEHTPLGDLAVCAPLVEAEAAEQGKSLQAHWAHVVIHGALHLVGYDHESEADAAVMEARERVLLAEFGVADPYQCD